MEEINKRLADVRSGKKESYAMSDSEQREQQANYKDEESAIKAVTSGYADIVSGISVESYRAIKNALLVA